MESNRWERVQALFHAASQLEAARQAEYLRAECGGDLDLMDDVLTMVEEDQRASGLLDGGVENLAGRALGRGVEEGQRIGPYRIERVLGDVRAAVTDWQAVTRAAEGSWNHAVLEFPLDATPMAT